MQGCRRKLALKTEGCYKKMTSSAGTSDTKKKKKKQTKKKTKPNHRE